MPLEEFNSRKGLNLTDAARQEIDRKVRRAAYSIISGKGATYYGIGSALARITDVILHDQRSILTLCAPSTEIAGVADVTVSVPRLLGGDGVLESFPLPLNETEAGQLQASARVVRQAIEELAAAT
jgi:L-lactate dehydrogenase